MGLPRRSGRAGSLAVTLLGWELFFGGGSWTAARTVLAGLSAGATFLPDECLHCAWVGVLDL